MNRLGVANLKKRLFVEGYSDKRFFCGLQRHINLADKFDVIFPGEQSRTKGKSGAITQFGLWLDEAAEIGRVEAAGLVVDADISPDGGFDQTNNQLVELIRDKGFRLVDSEARIYVHQKSKSKASFWISPSHRSDGYIETLMLDALAGLERDYFNGVVVPFLESLSPARFDSVNFNRAALYTFLAIQKKPDKSMPTLLDDALVDLKSGDLGSLSEWLSALYA